MLYLNQMFRLSNVLHYSVELMVFCLLLNLSVSVLPPVHINWQKELLPPVQIRDEGPDIGLS
jgi:hypothetical protein